jgi:signal peptide peptidase SppA
MTPGYEHVLSFALEHPWAITRPMLTVIAGILARRVAGQDVDRAAIEAALVNRKNLPQPRAGSIAILPVYGVLAPRMNLFSEMSGGTTFERLTGKVRAAVGEKSVKTIVLDIDSSGGSVAGATEFAHELLRARTKKPIVAQIQFTGASAAYWLASCCTEIVAAPSARVGSIGVYTSHDDISAALEQLGVKRTYLSAGEGKVDGHEAEALSAAAAERITAAIDEAYGQFVADVVKGRGAGMTADRVKKDWKAHVYGSAEALSLGMIDQIATLDETLTRVLTAGDADDQRAALDLHPSTGDTLQEPSPATSQDRQSELALERHLFELQLATAQTQK